MKFVKLKNTDTEILNTDHILKAFIDKDKRNILVVIFSNSKVEKFEFEGIEAAEAALYKILKQGNQAPIKFENSSNKNQKKQNDTNSKRIN